MTAQSDRINALISNIDEALSSSNPRPPMIVLGDSIIQSRQVLEQVRSFLLSLEPSHRSNASEIIPGDSEHERQSLEESLRLIVREELNQVQSQFTQTIQAEIKAMRQERRVLIRELRWLRQQRQQAKTPSVQTSQHPPSSQPPSEVSTLLTKTQPYIYPASKPGIPEVFPYAGVELPVSMQLESSAIPLSMPSPPQESEAETIDPTAIAQSSSDQTPSVSQHQVKSKVPPPGLQEIEKKQQTTHNRVKAESVTSEQVISTPSETLETPSTSLEEETHQKKSISVEAENSPSSTVQESTPSVVSLNLEPAQEVNNPETSSVPQSINNIFGVFNPNESTQKSQVVPSSSVTFTQLPTPTVPIEKPLDQDSYTLASPHENLLPHQQEEDDEDSVDSHLMVGKSVRQLLEEDLSNLEQQSFIGEEDPSSDFSTIDLTPTAASHPFENSQNIETFEDLCSESALVEDNPFMEADQSQMTLDELIATVNQDEVKRMNPEQESDLDDLNFEALNRKLQS